MTQLAAKRAHAVRERASEPSRNSRDRQSVSSADLKRALTLMLQPLLVAFAPQCLDGVTVFAVRDGGVGLRLCQAQL